jgi:hypothetical protein
LGQRLVVLRCLEAQCGDGQLLVDLFVNYDCDLEGANLFERMVAALVRIAQTPPSPDAHAQVVDDERALRVLVGGAPMSPCRFALPTPLMQPAPARPALSIMMQSRTAPAAAVVNHAVVAHAA